MTHLLRNKLALAIAAFVALLGWLALGATNNPPNMRPTSAHSDLQETPDAPATPDASEVNADVEDGAVDDVGGADVEAVDDGEVNEVDDADVEQVDDAEVDDVDDGEVDEVDDQQGDDVDEGQAGDVEDSSTDG